MAQTVKVYMGELRAGGADFSVNSKHWQRQRAAGYTELQSADFSIF